MGMRGRGVLHVLHARAPERCEQIREVTQKRILCSLTDGRYESLLQDLLKGWGGGGKTIKPLSGLFQSPQDGLHRVQAVISRWELLDLLINWKWKAIVHLVLHQGSFCPWLPAPSPFSYHLVLAYEVEGEADRMAKGRKVLGCLSCLSSIRRSQRANVVLVTLLLFLEHLNHW